MHRYKLLEYRAGATIEIIKCIPRGCREGVSKEPVSQKTATEIREANMRQAARKLSRKINANFRPGDWHITLTYSRDKRPDAGTAQKNINSFIAKMRDRFRRRVEPLKYIVVTEYKKKAIHHHLIINQINDGKKTTVEMAREAWRGMGNLKMVPLYEDGEYQRLADYLVKETEETFRDDGTPFRQRYSCSRNLINPKPKKRMVKAKEWKEEPKPRPGYYIIPETLYNGHDRLGFPYQRYVMVKIKPQESDWDEGRAGNVRSNDRNRRKHK